MATTVDITTITTEQRAQIIREERDALVLDWVNGLLRNCDDAERFLNARIEALGVKTITGDTTE